MFGISLTGIAKTRPRLDDPAGHGCNADIVWMILVASFSLHNTVCSLIAVRVERGRQRGLCGLQLHRQQGRGIYAPSPTSEATVARSASRPAAGDSINQFALLGGCSAAWRLPSHACLIVQPSVTQMALSSPTCGHLQRREERIR